MRRASVKIGAGSVFGEEADVAQRPAGMARITCAALAGAGIAGGATAGLIGADALYPGGAGRATIVRPHAIAPSRSARAASSPAALAPTRRSSARSPSPSPPPRRGRDRRPARRVVASARPARPAPKPTAPAASTRVPATSPAPRPSAPTQPVSPAAAPRQGATFDDSG
jgi:hypothetical protein